MIIFLTQAVSLLDSFGIPSTVYNQVELTGEKNNNNQQDNKLQEMTNLDLQSITEEITLKSRKTRTKKASLLSSKTKTGNISNTNTENNNSLNNVLESTSSASSGEGFQTNLDVDSRFDSPNSAGFIRLLSR